MDGLEGGAGGRGAGGGRGGGGALKQDVISLYGTLIIDVEICPDHFDRLI